MDNGRNGQGCNADAADFEDGVLLVSKQRGGELHHEAGDECCGCARTQPSCQDAGPNPSKGEQDQCNTIEAPNVTQNEGEGDGDRLNQGVNGPEWQSLWPVGEVCNPPGRGAI